METFKTIHLKPKISGLYCSPVQPHIVHLDAGRVSGSLQICLEPEGKSLRSKKGTPIQSGSFGPIANKFGPIIDPILVHLTQIFTGVSSNDIMYSQGHFRYALRVVIIIKTTQVSTIKIGTHLQLGPIGLFRAQFGPYRSM